MLNHKLLLGAAIGALMSGAALAQTADDGLPSGAGTLELRGRAVVVAPEDNSSSINVVGGHISTTVSVIPEADISYFLTNNIAIEGIAGVTEHTIKAKGTAAGNLTVGDVWLLPPTVTAQYHFAPGGSIDPYVGGGVNYTFFFGQSHQAPFTSATYDDHVGGALQAGLDFSLGGGWVANVDVKQLFLRTTAHTFVGPTPIDAKVALDPLLAGIGIGYRWGGRPTPAAYVPPPVPVAAPPAPPPAPPVEAARQFQVFFDFNKSTITAAAAKVIRSAADTVRAGGFAHIDVTGHTDTVGGAAYNQRLSEERAEAVKAQLVADGVASTEIATRGVGKTGLLVPTADGVREAQNRRAEIELK
jgi:outer membrane protein